MVRSHVKVFWLSKDNSIGHSKRKKKGRYTVEEMERQYSEWTRMDTNFAISARAAEDRTRWKEIVLISSVMPYWPDKLIG